MQRLVHTTTLPLTHVHGHGQCLYSDGTEPIHGSLASLVSLPSLVVQRPVHPTTLPRTHVRWPGQDLHSAEVRVGREVAAGVGPWVAAEAGI